ncbi:hypothetical protein MTR67_013849 [Solanum verrucosum]|uniref:Uncharacterized protein n=1 Tax=Solanum verrucosum TaxID=315347 RepID=A0AAF0QIC6_SOLVR|nr:hypothetical protein MTR67_013849 [Solanum verrucosum]
MNGDAGIAVFAQDYLFLSHCHGGRELGGLLWFIARIHLLQNSLQGRKLREGGFLEGYMTYGQDKGGTSFLEGTSMTGNKHYSSFSEYSPSKLHLTEEKGSLVWKVYSKSIFTVRTRRESQPSLFALQMDRPAVADVHRQEEDQKVAGAELDEPVYRPCEILQLVDGNCGQCLGSLENVEFQIKSYKPPVRLMDGLMIRSWSRGCSL